MAFSQEQIHAIREKKKKKAEAPPPAITEPAPEAERSDVGFFCHHCGHKLNDQAIFCAQCGTRREEMAQLQHRAPEQHKDQSAKQQLSLVTSIGMLIVAVLSIGMMVFFTEYQTLSPCSALKQEIREWRIREVDQAKENGATKLGRAIGLGLTQWFYDSQVNQLSMGKCLSAIARVKLGGKSPLEELKK